ncbi:MAG: glycosyltransferase family 39 protein, partial [archaeon GB-1867-035]|nr:glycosyltransferase family 39 protein [Candidatus Culexmicrobium profundum]
MTKDFLIPGIDGPYYLIQVEAILERGEMVYGDPPFIFYLAALFATLCGNVRMGVAIAVSLMISLTCFPAYWLFTRLSKNIFPAIIGSILLVFSPQMVRLSGDLMKNAAGVFFLILSIYYVLLASSNWRLKNYIPAILSIFF